MSSELGLLGRNDQEYLIRHLDHICDFFNGEGRQELSLQTLELKRKLLENELQIVVVGSFKRGKSTLINALVGESVLPMGVVPLTSVVTLVRCGKFRFARVEFLDGRREEISFERIPDFVAEELNPENEKKVGQVIVELPSLFLREGTSLVDTPGVGSVYRHNTQVAERYFPKADAMILVLSVDPPISELELEFLNSIRRWAKRLYVVVNKTDYISPEELAQSLQFIKHTLQSVLGEGEIFLFPISAKRGLEAKKIADAGAWRQSGMGILEESLERLLTDEKRKLVYQTTKERAERILDGLRLETQLELEALTGSLKDIEKQATSLSESLEWARRKRYEFSRLYQVEIKEHLAVFDEKLYDYIRSQGKKVMNDLEILYNDIREEASSTVRIKLNKVFLSSAEESFLHYLEKEEPQWTASFQKMTDRYLKSVTELLNEFLQKALPSGGRSHEPIHCPTLDILPSSVWFVLEEVAVWVKSFLPTPTLRMFKPVFLKAIKNQVIEAMDINAGRLRYDYAMRLEKAASEVQNAAEEFFDSSISALEKAAAAIEAHKALTQAEVDRKIDLLRARFKTIKELRADLIGASQ